MKTLCKPSVHPRRGNETDIRRKIEDVVGGDRRDRAK